MGGGRGLVGAARRSINYESLATQVQKCSGIVITFFVHRSRCERGAWRPVTYSWPRVTCSRYRDTRSGTARVTRRSRSREERTVSRFSESVART